MKFDFPTCKAYIYSKLTVWGTLCIICQNIGKIISSKLLWSQIYFFQWKLQIVIRIKVLANWYVVLRTFDMPEPSKGRLRLGLISTFSFNVNN